ncbi:MAG TPA: hypothetical protein VFV23_07295 [Verrucomicrobiae bacterium]|nr:hypothetical protein [Verrucomicrobiae bacterium]
MPDIHFNCVKCTQKLVIDAEGIGMTVSCPTCNCALVVPAQSLPPILPPPKPDESRKAKEEIARLRKIAEDVRSCAKELECEIEDGVAELIARSSNGNPEEAKIRLRRILQRERSGTLAPVLTLESAVKAMNKLFPENPNQKPLPGRAWV